MHATARLYRRAIPFWIALAALAAIMRLASPRTVGVAAVGGLLTGIEPITVLRAILRRPRPQLGQVMLCFGLPTLARRAGEQDPLFRDDVSLGESFWSLAVGVRYHTPQETLRAGLPVLGLRGVEIPSVRLPGEEPAPQPQRDTPAPRPDVPEPAPSAAGRILIYHTHTSESYLPVSGRDHLQNGAGDIVRVGEYLAEALQAEGFAVTHDTTINDQFPFRDAYRRSLETAQRLLAAVPDPVAVIDLHRDATPGVVGTIELGGEKVARLALVVGTDRLGLAHPHWRENLAFANALRDAAERLYPGLLARIDIADARYNQHLSPRSIIVEIGNQYSTAVEVYRAAACLAKILVEVRRALPAKGAAAANTPPAAGRPPG
ncbi:MAG: stage II sporulation protein P [Bacteroidota bacterium]